MSEAPLVVSRLIQLMLFPPTDEPQVDASGRLYYYRNREDEEPKGYQCQHGGRTCILVLSQWSTIAELTTHDNPFRFVNLAEMTSITTTDPEGKRFQLITPDRTWVLLAEDEQTMITWMDELHYRKSLIPRQAEDGGWPDDEKDAH